MSFKNLWGRITGSSTGWKRSARINCIILIITSLFMASFSAISVSNAGLGIIPLFQSNCESAAISAVKLAFDLLINIACTLVIFNSPSREEIDVAHSKTSWLDIGVPSIRNVFATSNFKTWCWAALLITSIPFHIFSNALIFEMGHRESSFRLTIATEDFLRGKPYYPPGASLMISGERFFGDSFSRMDRGRFGIPIDPKEYDAIHSPTIANLSATASEGHQWDWLTPEECMTEYVECDGLKKHRDLVLVVDQPDGWYNGLFTRLQITKEWALFEDYQPLRVTDAKGDQVSSYRLQLPYKYGIPLLCVNAGLHWVLSNTIYLVVSVGGSSVLVGYSNFALSVMIVISIAIICVPILVGLEQSSPNMIHPGSNSLSISAACHASSISDTESATSELRSVQFTARHNNLPERDGEEVLESSDLRLRHKRAAPTESTNQKGSEANMLPSNPVYSQLSSSLEPSDQNGSQKALKKVAQRKIRWGVVRMPREWYAAHTFSSGPIGHLGFGTEKDDVSPPVSGKLYA
ncbi:hypothetical protein F5X97DRAFT_327717 [Nemania serpens]|nr:hypothetical protein F5X97DRAFT_327717 [Nemania serpens]